MHPSQIATHSQNFSRKRFGIPELHLWKYHPHFSNLSSFYEINLEISPEFFRIRIQEIS